MKESSEQIIDKSCKVALCFFVASAGMWLLAAALLAYVGALKLTDPFFLSSYEFFSYGKIKIAQALSLIHI